MDHGREALRGEDAGHPARLVGVDCINQHEFDISTRLAIEHRLCCCENHIFAAVALPQVIGHFIRFADMTRVYFLYIIIK